MSIATKTGDKGKTDGPSGLRVPKYDSFCSLVGTLDELNAALGIVAADLGQKAGMGALRAAVRQVQFDLIDLGADLYTGEDVFREEVPLRRLEEVLAEHEPDLTGFVIPTGKASSQAQLARAICRRAERAAHAARTPANNVSIHHVRYLNRLSDVLYVVAMILNPKSTPWERAKLAGDSPLRSRP